MPYRNDVQRALYGSIRVVFDGPPRAVWILHFPAQGLLTDREGAGFYYDSEDGLQPDMSDVSVGHIDPFGVGAVGAVDDGRRQKDLVRVEHFEFVGVQVFSTKRFLDMRRLDFDVFRFEVVTHYSIAVFRKSAGLEYALD